MFRLPKGTPLFENLDACDLQLDNIITKLAHGCFTGYASLTFQNAISILVFESGKLISIIFENNQSINLNGFEAMTALAEQMQERTSSKLNVYRLSGDLTMCIHALLQGEKLYRAQELALIDIKVLLERIKNEQMNCCMRIYTNDRSAMIFYKEGNPLGFFHDGAEEIETSPGDSQQLAQDPKAKLDLYTTVSANELMAHDLLDLINVDNIWNTAVNRHQSKGTSA
jgi:hypothetical protein